MKTVYKIVENLDYGRFTSWVTESGKILETTSSYDNGLQSTYILDSCVDVDSADWQDSNSSIQHLYWVTEEELKTLPDSVAEVKYRFEFNEPAPTRDQAGDRKVLTPLDLLVLMGKPVTSAA